MRLVFVLLMLALATGCTAPDATPAASSLSASSTTATLATTGSLSALPDMYEEWSVQFDAIAKAHSGPVCGPANVQGAGCAAYLTAIVEKTSDLESTIRARPDVASYVDTLIETGKITKASERYAKLRCYAGGGSLDECQGEMIAITMGSVLLTTKLNLDELKRK